MKTHIESLHKHYNEVFVDKYVIMPNHVQMVIVINAGGASAAPTTTLGNLVRGFKAGVSQEHIHLKTMNLIDEFFACA